MERSLKGGGGGEGSPNLVTGEEKKKKKVSRVASPKVVQNLCFRVLFVRGPALNLGETFKTFVFVVFPFARIYPIQVFGFLLDVFWDM